MMKKIKKFGILLLFYYYLIRIGQITESPALIDKKRKKLERNNLLKT